METQAEYRSRQRPMRKKLFTLLLELDEMEVRMRDTDRRLAEQGL